MARGLSAAGRARVEAVARAHLERGWHSGAQLAVYRDGALALDLRLGAAVERRMLWFSATKPVTAVAALMLVERGAIGLDTPIADVWPEFAQGGKATCTLRHVLTHRGGFPVLPPDFDLRAARDWAIAARMTAALPARWPPGSTLAYHPLTYGFALGEVIRRVDGREPRAFFAEEIFQPLGMDASLGTDAPGSVLLPEAMSEVTFLDPEGAEGRTSEIARRFSDPAVLAVQLPAANGIGTAEALARFYASLLASAVPPGEWHGARLLAAATVAEATRVQAETDADAIGGLPASFGLGFMVGGVFPPFSEPGVFGHSGQQCAVAYADPARGLAVAYLTNGLHDPLVVQLRAEEVFWAVAEACA